MSYRPSSILLLDWIRLDLKVKALKESEFSFLPKREERRKLADDIFVPSAIFD